MTKTFSTTRSTSSQRHAPQMFSVVSMDTNQKQNLNVRDETYSEFHGSVGQSAGEPKRKKKKKKRKRKKKKKEANSEEQNQQSEKTLTDTSKFVLVCDVSTFIPNILAGVCHIVSAFSEVFSQRGAFQNQQHSLPDRQLYFTANTPQSPLVIIRRRSGQSSLTSSDRHALDLYKGFSPWTRE